MLVNELHYFSSSLAFEQDMLKKAHLVSQKSPDPSTKVGAIIHNDGYFYEGYNHIPAVLETADIWNDREEKYANVIHAEMDAMSKCVNLEYATMFTSFCVCDKCAPYIVHRKIARVVTMYPDINMPRFDVWSGYWKKALTILTNGGISVTMFKRDYSDVMCFYPGIRTSTLVKNGNDAIDFRTL